MKLFIVIIYCFLSFQNSMGQQSGNVDLDYGTNGFSIKSLTIQDDILMKSVLQDDDKLICVGYKGTSGTYNGFAVRFKANGTIDSTFNTNGIVSISIGSSETFALNACIEPNGKIIVTGYYTNSQGKPAIWVSRLNSNGSYDLLFGTNGIKTIDLNTNGTIAWGVNRLSSGKIVLCGTYNSSAVLFMLNNDGTYDSSFNEQGYLILNNYDYSQFNGVRVDSKNNIFPFGYATIGSDNFGIICKVKSTGTIDLNFGVEGFFNLNGGTGYEMFSDIALNNNFIYGICNSHSNSKYVSTLVKIDTMGVYETTEFTNGSKSFYFNNNSTQSLSIVIQPDSKICIGGYYSQSIEPVNKPFLARINPNGTFDNTFGVNGLIDYSFSFNSEKFIRSINFASNGNLICSGYGIQLSTGNDIFSFSVFSYFGTVPIELSSFGGTYNNGEIQLNWSTHTEINNLGFDIEKRIGTSWVKIGFVSGSGTTTIPNKYYFSDKSLQSSTGEHYRLKQLDLNGNSTYSPEIFIKVDELSFKLIGNYPNPFNPETQIHFNSPSNKTLLLEIFNSNGQLLIAKAINEVNIGFNSVSLDMSRFSSGTYFYTLSNSLVSLSGKMTLIK